MIGDGQFEAVVFLLFHSFWKWQTFFETLFSRLTGTRYKSRLKQQQKFRDRQAKLKMPLKKFRRSCSWCSLYRVFIYNVFGSIDSVSSWPGASFQNSTFWDSSALFWITEYTVSSILCLLAKVEPRSRFLGSFRKNVGVLIKNNRVENTLRPMTTNFRRNNFDCVTKPFYASFSIF
jgi:hypothetical protein